MAKDDKEFMLSDEDLAAVTGGASTFYSVGDPVKGEYGEYRVITYYDENKKATAHIDCPIGKVDGMMERLNGRGMTFI